MKKGDEFKLNGRLLVVMGVKRKRFTCFAMQRKQLCDFPVLAVEPPLTGNNYAEALQLVDDCKDSLKPGTILNLYGKRYQVDAVARRQVVARVLDENPFVTFPIDGPWWIEIVGDRFLKKLQVAEGSRG